MAEVLTELVARIMADATQLKKELASAEKDITGLGKTTDKQTRSIKESFLEIGKVATVMGVAITAAMTKMIMSFTKTGSELYDLSLKTGVSVKALAGLKYAAEQNGASLGTIEMAIKRVASAMSDAESETSESAKAFTKLGISVEDLKGLNPEQQFLKIAGAVAQIPDPMTRSAIAVDLFGRSGTDMLPMLAEGEAGLKKMMSAGVKFSGWTAEGAKLADALGDSFDTLKTAMGGVFNAIGASLAPALTSLAKTLTNITGSILVWTQAHPGLVKAIGTATLAMGLFATGIGLVSIAVKVLGTTINLYFAGILLIIGAVVVGIVLLIDWFNRAGIASQKLADENRAALEKQQAADKTYFANKRAAANSATETAIANIRKEYGEQKDLSKSLIDQAYDVRDARIRAIDDAERAAKSAHGKALSRAEEEYRLSLSKEERALQDQVDAIDKLTSIEDLAITRANEQKRLASLTGKEYYEYAEEIKRNELLRSREVEKDAIRAKIQELRDETGEVVAKAKEQRDAKIASANEALLVELSNQATARAVAEQKLVDDIKGYETDKATKIRIENEKLAVIIENIGLEETRLADSYTLKLNQAHEFVENLNAENARIRNVDYTVTRREVTIYSSSGSSAPEPPGGSGGHGGATRGFASGGIVPGPIGQPQLAMVHGGETIIPAGESGGITINFTQPIFMEREDQMNQLVDKIRKGIQRQDRLRFGGAYNG